MAQYERIGDKYVLPSDSEFAKKISDVLNRITSIVNTPIYFLPQKALVEYLHYKYDDRIQKAIQDGEEWAKDFFDKIGNWPNGKAKISENVTNNWDRNWFNLNRDGFANFQVQWGRDPITLDLDGDGIETYGHNGASGVMFDHTGDGIKNPTGWVGSDDGFLVLDRNHDGLINNGTELFGDSTLLANGDKAAHGFAALADLDSNKDEVIDAQDEQFSQLKVWRDLNGDGISQSGELFTLNQLGIASLNLKY